MKKHLYAWQEECLRYWTANNGRGIVRVVTGAGKTILALAAAEHIKTAHPDSRVYVVVPKTFLVTQWMRALREELSVSPKDIGCYSGRHKDPPGRDFMIYVINSARYTLARAIVSDFQAGRPVLLIADECHHYGTAENARIFNFLPYLPGDGRYFSMGLSATPQCANYKTVLVPALGGEIYRFGFEQALDAGIISPFTLFNIALSFDEDERDDYDRYTQRLRHALHDLKERFPYLRALHGVPFFEHLNAIARSKDRYGAELSQYVQQLLYSRTNILYHAKGRIGCVVALTDLIRPTAKILLFTERIETTNIVFNALKGRVKGGLGVYHSALSEGARTRTLRRFADGDIRVLVSCKALDEGLNVPEADVGIIVSSTRSDRQRIQRMGRILRKKEGIGACLYYLYVKDTAEEMTLLPTLAEDAAGLSLHSLSYNAANGLSRVLYDICGNMVMERVHALKWPPSALYAVEENIRRGRVADDWLLSEGECLTRMRAAGTKAEKNYYVTMGLLIKARAAREAFDGPPEYCV